MATRANSSGTAGSGQISEREFRLIADLIYATVGINLTDAKKMLVQTRLGAVLRNEGWSSFEEYYQHVRADASGERLVGLVDRISTNHSHFFREADHLDFLRTTVLPEIEARCRPGTELRIWSAGCAAGEEAYSLAMVLHGVLGAAHRKRSFRILGTDISATALAQARLAEYGARSTAGVPLRYRRYIEQLGPERFAVREELKRMVVFRRLNLMRDSYPFQGKFHAVFCRNVMIYFDADTRQRLAQRLAEYLHPGGYLFIGHSETLGRKAGLLDFVQPAVYQR